MHVVRAQGACSPQLLPPATSTLPLWTQASTLSNFPRVSPFCSTNGFSVVLTAFESTPGTSCQFTDLHVVVGTRTDKDSPILNNSVITSDVSRYFSNIVYAGTAGQPSLFSRQVSSRKGKHFVMFTFRVPAPAVATTYTLPFTFVPNFYFGDRPWDIYAAVSEPVNPPDLPIFLDNLNYQGTNQSPTIWGYTGTLLFDLPWFPIVGSANVSSVMSLMTGFTLDPLQTGRALAIMLLPNAGGVPPVLTVDVPVLDVGYPALGGNLAFPGAIRMCPGAQIRVGNGATSSILRLQGTFVGTGRDPAVSGSGPECFTQVSKGIVVEPGCSLEALTALTQTLLSDAETAVHIKRGATFKSNNGTKYLNNFRHILLDNSGSSGVNLIATFGGGNTIARNTTAPLIKAPYSGMPASLHPRGRGIEIINHPNIVLGAMTLNNLNTGIYAVNSSVDASSCAFNSMLNSVGGHISNGYAIYATGSGKETITYNSPSPGLSANIFASARGIYAQNTSLSVRNKTISVLSAPAVEVTGAKNQTISIRDNTITAPMAVRARNNMPIRSGLVANNTVNASSSPGVPEKDAMLFAEFFSFYFPNFGLPKLGWNVQNNLVNISYLNTGHQDVQCQLVSCQV